VIIHVQYLCVCEFKDCKKGECGKRPNGEGARRTADASIKGAQCWGGDGEKFHINPRTFSSNFVYRFCSNILQWSVFSISRVAVSFKSCEDLLLRRVARKRVAGEMQFGESSLDGDGALLWIRRVVSGG